MAPPILSSAYISIKRYGLDRTSVHSKAYPLYNSAPHCCPYQSDARMLSRPYAVADLHATLWEPPNREHIPIALQMSSEKSIAWFKMDVFPVQMHAEICTI
jgi:hypothetical protein